MNNVSLRDRVTAMFLLVGIGDALGLPVETMTAGAINKKFGRITDYIDTAFHRDFVGSPKGTTSDDTQFTLAVARSLTRSKGFDMNDMARAHIEAADVTTRGWGGSTRDSIARLKAGVHWSGSGSPGGTGNGVAIKISAMAALLASKEKNVFWYCMPEHYRDISTLARMTHNTTLGVTSGIVMVDALLFALWPSKLFYITELHGVAALVESLEKDISKNKLSPALRGLRNVDFITPDNEIRKLFGDGGCVVYESLPVALALFLRKPDSIDALYDAVNFGGDTDSVASMVGALIGARNGTTIIPEHLLAGLQGKDEILAVANEFCDTFNIN